MCVKGNYARLSTYINIYAIGMKWRILLLFFEMLQLQWYLFEVMVLK